MDNLNGGGDDETNEDEEEDDEKTKSIPSPGYLHPNDIELKIIDHDSIDEDVDADNVDGPRLRRESNGGGNGADAAAGFTDLFSFLSNKERNFSERRMSTRSSTTSIDTVHLKAIVDKDRSVSR